MTRARARTFLLVYFGILYGAVLLRVDWFPLSWVPMYSERETGASVSIGIGNLADRAAGIPARRADGTGLTLNRFDLNIPPANFRRLYQERAFNVPPPWVTQQRTNLSAFNRWWYEKFVGPDPLLHADYPRNLLDSINRTLHYGPDDPDRLVALEVAIEFATFERADLDQGVLDRPVRVMRTAQITESGNTYEDTPIAGRH